MRRNGTVPTQRLVDVVAQAETPVMTTAEIAAACNVDQDGVRETLREIEADGGPLGSHRAGQVICWFHQREVPSELSDAASD